MNSSQTEEVDVLIVGASLGGLRVAEGLRKLGFDGTVKLVGNEAHLPYDRPPLSKEVLTGDVSEEECRFRDRGQLNESGIDLETAAAALAVDLDASSVLFEDRAVRFGHLVVATGARARTLPGAAELAGVHTMRTLEDARAIRSEFVADAGVVVVGAGFIGAEVASSARKLGLQVTVIEALPNPLCRAVGEGPGHACADLHTENGTALVCGASVSHLEGNDHVEAVVLDNGDHYEASLVVAGIGVQPNIDWLVDSGVPLGNGVRCDEFLRAGSSNVYALGDVAEWFNPRYGESMRVEHWTTTVEQAQVVAHNIANPDAPRECTAIPYFWSDQYGHRIQFFGRTRDTEIEEFEVGDARYFALYRREAELAGVLAIDGTLPLMRLRGMSMQGSVGWDDAVDVIRNSA